MRRFVPFLLALLMVSCSASEPMDRLCKRVFSLAGERYAALDAQLDSVSLPRYADASGALVTSDINWWCSGFFPGALWMVYEQTGDPEVKALAWKNTLKLSNLPQEHTDHDIGFQINCSFGRALDVTGDESCLPVIRDAAAKLAGRFSPVTGTIKSWDFLIPGRGWQYPVIIDNMMNLELLMRASKLFGADSLRAVAVAHASTAMRTFFRSDCSCVHLVDFDVQDGHVRSRQTVQGYSDDSAWARGQAWALYGFTMMFRESGEEAFLSQAQKIAVYLLGRLPSDGVPFWDFDDPAAPAALRDASAAAIMASAFAELCTLTRDRSLARRCRRMAETIVRTLASPAYLAPDGSPFLLMHSVGNLPSGSEIDVSLSYADYYYLEALGRLDQLLQ